MIVSKNYAGKEIMVGTYIRPTIVHISWIGHIVDVDCAKRAIEQIVEFTQKNPTLAILNDNREQMGRWPDVGIDWLYEVFIGGLAKNGLKFFAHVHSHSLFTQLSADNFLPDIPKYGIEQKTFFDDRSAIIWLQEKLEMP